MVSLPLRVPRVSFFLLGDTEEQHVDEKQRDVSKLCQQRDHPVHVNKNGVNEEGWREMNLNRRPIMTTMHR